MWILCTGIRFGGLRALRMGAGTSPDRILAAPGPRSVLGRALRTPLGVTWGVIGGRFGYAGLSLEVNLRRNFANVLILHRESISLEKTSQRHCFFLPMRPATWEFFCQHCNFNACKPNCSRFFSGSAAEAAGLWSPPTPRHEGRGVRVNPRNK